tara:strand:- start:1877 stop:2335 length:459 start_codon:yes stop_codon:yes gene_type:complete
MSWVPISIIQESDPIVIRCRNDNDDNIKLFTEINSNEYKMIGSDVTINIDINLFLEESSDDENELEDVRVTIEKDNYRDYIECMKASESISYLKVDCLDRCAICCDTIKDDDVIGITPCSHYFHNKCLKIWLTEECVHPKCPMCNSDVRTID